MQNNKRILKLLRSHPCKLVLAAGIVNPMGPTLSGLLLLGSKKGADWDLYRFSLNPFQQELTKLRAANPDEAASPSKVMEEEDDEEQRLGFGLMSAPTFLFLRAGAKEISACVHLIASASDNFTSTLDRLHEFPGNPWDRISTQVNETANSKSMPKPPAERHITDQDIENYTSMIFDEKNSREEMAAFRTAWEGSIEFQKSLGNLKLSKTAMTADEVIEAMDILLRSL